MRKQKQSTNTVRRFSRWRCLEHFLGATSFSLLAITGLAQKFYTAAWAQAVIETLGGIDNSRLIHRYTGLVFSLLLLQHIIVAGAGVVAGRWRPSMMITRKDFDDAVVNLRYYLGAADHPARCDRFDYKQKFEYWGVVFGGVAMIVSGLILWFPIAFFSLIPFAPGELVPASKAVHTNEAMLAFLVIVLWHIYNAVFSPEVFPLDQSMITGRISVERMKEEHPLEYARILKERGLPEVEGKMAREKRKDASAA